MPQACELVQKLINLFDASLAGRSKLEEFELVCLKFPCIRILM